MAKKLYVGNLSYNMTDADLKTLFEGVGAVESAVVIMDKFSGRSKGFGFVEMGSEDDAAKAIKEFDGKEIEGRNIKVNEARPQTERPNNFNRE